MHTETFPTYDTVDLFAGPGGWSVAAHRLGLREIGIEFDKAAHLTRRAAGFHTIRDDVRNWGPANFPNARGLIASPPCQTFSAAGKGAGRRALDVVLASVQVMHAWHGEGRGWTKAEPWEDERTGLVLEPLRWALDAIRLGRPYEWLAFEQVPTVLPVWQAMADVLRAEGYSVAVGNLQAEQYGVPQTRKRAVLIACQGYAKMPFQVVTLPTPTHSRYHTRDKTRLDPGVLPWVSMAQALGWGGPVVSAQSVAGVGRAARDAAAPGFTVTETTSRVMRSNYGTGGDPAVRGERSQDELAATVTSKVDRNLWFAGAGQTAQDTAGQIPRAEVEPAHTVTGKGTAAWVHERPATTVAGDPRLGQPGHKCMTESCCGTEGVTRQFAEGSVRVSVQEAACLQSFPAGFPWQGSRTKQYQQVGNAIPPLLAEAVLRQVVS